MKKTFRSISWKIWYSMARTTIILLVLALFANITILKMVKEDFVFEQLRESAKAKRNREQAFLPASGETEKPLWVAHFGIDKNEEGFKIFMDNFTKALYGKEKDGEIIYRVVENIEKQGGNKEEGVVKDEKSYHYYYVDWYKKGESAMVFLTSIERSSKLDVEIFAIIIIFLIISFFTSRLTAKKIAEPIQELEIFAEEISKRNWKVEVPETDPDEIGLLAEALDKMRYSLKIAEERDREFLQSTSHDLKTPVMIIKGYAQAILDGVGIDLENSAAEVIKTESERLERRITQLLRLNTLGHALEYSENREIIRLDRMLKSLVLKFKVIKPELYWELDLKELEIHADREGLLVAFENIIENQLRYAESTVGILMSCDSKIEVRIFNDGPNFEVENPMELFDAYKKDREGKFGLGLAIVKQVIEAHGGTVTAYNIEKGVEFKINFGEFPEKYYNM